MAEQGPKNAQQGSDEIDLGQLFRLIGKGFQNVFNIFLKVFIYLKKNFIILGILVVAGFIIGFTLSRLITKNQQIEVIVKPNLESKNYLYDVVNEIQANIQARDTAFFNSIGIEVANMRGYQIKIEAVTSGTNKEVVDMEYLELLQKFENTTIVSDVLRAEILNKSSLNHRITFRFRDKEDGREFAKKVINYINSNEFFSDLVTINKENAETRIEENKKLISQIDLIIANYSAKMTEMQSSASDGRILLDNEERVNLTGLLELKNVLIRDIEGRKLNLLEQKEPISIINFGNPYQVQRTFFGKKIILIPTLLVLLFFLFDFARFLNRKASELNKTEF